ncbi:MAG: DUF4367 domain-containing protein [Ruminococcus sp.]|nr:DUF4367 domain-containing protein [Ruminococcus sp.]
MDKIINNELLVKSLEIYENQRLKEYDALKPFAPSESFIKKMDKLIKSQSNYFYKATRTKARKVAAILVAAIVLTASAMSVTAIRESILGFFISHTSEVDVIEYNNENPESYPKTLNEHFTPSYIPEGYKLEDETSDSTSRELYYVKGENYIDFEQFTKAEYSSASDSEFSAPEKVTDNGMEYIMRTDEDMIMLVWEDKGYVFEMTGFVDKDEMFKIARSVKAGEVK